MRDVKPHTRGGGPGEDVKETGESNRYRDSFLVMKHTREARIRLVKGRPLGLTSWHTPSKMFSALARLSLTRWERLRLPTTTVEETNFSAPAEVESDGVLTTVFDSEVTPLSIPSVEPVALGAQHPGDDLATFLLRPVQIKQLTWTAATGWSYIDPWAIMLNTTTIRNKLQHFALFRAKLVIEAVVDGTPYHYGRFQLSYQPCHGAPGAPYSLVKQSQLMHACLDPCSSNRVELTLPCISKTGWVDLQDEYGAQLGIVHLDVLNTLMMANAASPSDVTITIWGHFEDPHLSIPTPEALVTFTPQAGPKGKQGEYGKKVAISDIASAVATASSHLTQVPIIGPLALATQGVATTLGSIASMFGFSRPVELEPSTLVHQRAFDTFASSAGNDLSQKLTLDPKAELTIDPGVMGLEGEDELVISRFTKSWSLLTNYTWSTTSAPGDIIATIPVTPCLLRKIGTEYQPTSLAYASWPFQSWRGSLKFKIEVIGTPYHRGKFRVSYSPLASAPTSATYNVTYNAVVDINTEEGEVTVFTAEWGQAAQFLTTELNPTPFLYNTYSCNGEIFISIVTKLQSPLSTQGVTLNIYVMAGDDFQLTVPSLAEIPALFAVEQAGPLGRLMDVTQGGQSETSVPLTGDGEATDGTDLTFIGESFVSFRPLLKRTSYYGAAIIPLTPGPTGACTTRWQSFAYPQIPNNPYSEWCYLGQVPADTRLTWYAFLRPCYLGHRGSTRIRIVPYALSTNDRTLSLMSVFRATTSKSVKICTPVPTAVVSTLCAQMATTFQQGTDGMLIENNPRDVGVQVELAPYMQVRYYTGINDADNCERAIVTKLFSNVTASQVDCDLVFHSCGEDLTMLWFTGAPSFTLT